MRKATPKTFPVNNKGNVIEIDNYGTTTFIGFAQILYKAGLIEYKMYCSAAKYIFSESFCTQMVNEHPELFPINF